MDSMSSPFRAGDAAPRRRLRLGWIAVLAGAVVFATVMAWNMGAYAGASDQSGYMNQARLLRDGRIRVARRVVPILDREGLSDFAFVPLGFVPSRGDTMTPTYPIGLPLLVIATSWLTGWDAAPHVTMWLHALTGVALMFALARAFGLPAPWAAFGSLVLAMSPVYVFMSLSLMSDVPALVWTTAAVLCAWRSRSHAGWAAAAGGALAIAVLIRPSNFIAMAPIAVALGGGGRRWLALIAAGLPGALAFATYNHAAYGSAFVTGYGLTWNDFSGGLWTTSLAHYARWLPVALTPAVVLALGLPWLGWHRSTAVIGVWILAFGGFYSCYAFTHEAWWYLRFLLPAFPPLIAAALLVAKKIAEAPRLVRWRQQLPETGTVGVALVLLWSLPWDLKLHAFHSGREQRDYPDAAAWARTHLPARAILVSMQTSGALFYYTDFTFIRLDQLQPRHVAALDQITAREGRPLVAMLFPSEPPETLRQRLPGPWTKLGTVGVVTFWLRTLPAAAAP